jgi:hypothetical protein
VGYLTHKIDRDQTTKKFLKVSFNGVVSTEINDVINIDANIDGRMTIK